MGFGHKAVLPASPDLRGARAGGLPSGLTRRVAPGAVARRVASPAVARILIVGGGCRGRRLAARLVEDGRHAVRITTRGESGRAAIEATGAECLIGTPDRLASLRGALDGVTIACWMLATARGDRAQVQALHGSRLESFLSQAIDTTMRGFIYEAPGAGGSAGGDTGGDRDAAAVRADVAAGMPGAGRIVPARAIVEGERIVRSIVERNAIPAAILMADVEDPPVWQAEAWATVGGLLGDRDGRPDALSSC